MREADEGELARGRAAIDETWAALLASRPGALATLEGLVVAVRQIQTSPEFPPLFLGRYSPG